MLVILIVLVIGVVGFVGWRVMNNKENNGEQKSQSSSDESNNSAYDPLPGNIVKNIGFKLDTYNAATKMAGDLKFADFPALKNSNINNKLWADFGEIDLRDAKKERRNPQTVFLLPGGTPITAMVDGKVEVMEFEKDDYAIMITPNSDSRWKFEHEHITKPRVKTGDTVKAGDVIAEVLPMKNYEYGGNGMFEIGMYHPHANGRGGYEACVFKYLHNSVKEDILPKTTAFYKAWEDFRGDTQIYDQENFDQPGCVSDEIIGWEEPMVMPPN